MEESKSVVEIATACGAVAAHANELSIASSIAAGDQSAFERLMRSNNRRLYRLARVTLRDPAEAEDALQDAYISAYRSMGQFRGDASLSTWLSRLVLNECLARLRRSTRRNNVIPIVNAITPIESSSMFANEPDLPEKELGRAQMRDLLERKVDELPENFRAVFVLRSVEELSVDETAQCLSIPEETVRSRHFRAKAMLRDSLARELNLAERDLFEFGGRHCDQVVARVLARLAPSSTN
jgi:RNA polymerase sigma factor (sigma-70 family)